MSTPLEIRDFIIAGLAQWDTDNAFYSRMPDEPDDCLTVYEYAGSPQRVIGGGLAAFEVVRVQVSIRAGGATPYATARAWLVEVRNLLDVVGGQTISGTYYMRIMSSDTPTRLEPDNQDRETLVLNFEVTKEQS